MCGVATVIVPISALNNYGYGSRASLFYVALVGFVHFIPEPSTSFIPLLNPLLALSAQAHGWLKPILCLCFITPGRQISLDRLQGSGAGVRHGIHLARRRLQASSRSLVPPVAYSAA